MTVAEYLNQALASLGRTPQNVSAVYRYAPELGLWLQIGTAEFIAAAQRVPHPLSVSHWYRIESDLEADDDKWLVYNGSTTTVIDPELVQSFGAAELQGSAPFPAL